MTSNETRRHPIDLCRLIAVAGVLTLAMLQITSASTVGAPAQTGLAQYVRNSQFPQPSGFVFQNASWVTLAPSGSELYVLQRGTPAVSLWSPAGKLLSAWKTTALGDPHSLKFQALADGSMRVWITDMAPPLLAGTGYGHCLKQFTAQGVFLGSIGRCGENSQGTGLNPVQFDKVTDVSFDNDGLIWVTDGDLSGLNNRVLQLSAAGAVVQSWSAPGNQPGNGPREFNLPHAIDVDACDRVWVADALNHRVQVIRTDGTFLQQLQCFGTDGVYGLRVRKMQAGMQLFTTSSPTTSPTGGTARVFDVSSNCGAPTPVPNGCLTAFRWEVPLPAGTSVAMLHALDASQDGQSVFLATLGGNLPVQQWIKVHLPEKRRTGAAGFRDELARAGPKALAEGPRRKQFPRRARISQPQSARRFP